MARNIFDDQVYITDSTVPISSAVTDITTELAGKQDYIQVEDEGVPVGIPGYGTTWNFTGAGVTVTDLGSHVLKIDVSGGGTGTASLTDMFMLMGG